MIKSSNRGISGDVAMGVYDRLDPILKGKPAKIFLLLGLMMLPTVPRQIQL